MFFRKRYCFSMSTRTPAEQDELHERVRRLFEHQISFNEHLGLRVVTLSPEPVTIAFDMRPEYVGHFLYGRLHGGVISSVMDVTAGLAIMMGVAEYNSEETADQIMSRFDNFATIDMRVDYLRPGIGESFTATAEVVRLGKRLGVSRSMLTNDNGSLIATGNASFMVS